MMYHYPTPQELGFRIPAHVARDRFCAGFAHALKGGQLTRVEYLRLSFREGFRCAKLYLRLLRRQRGLLEFPARYKFRLTVSE
jgi:hypothetical protein